MPKQVGVCRVCGKEYSVCRSSRLETNAFNWREVACSPECGMKYFQMVEEGSAWEEGGRQESAACGTSQEGTYHGGACCNRTGRTEV